MFKRMVENRSKAYAETMVDEDGDFNIGSAMNKIMIPVVIAAGCGFMLDFSVWSVSTENGLTMPLPEWLCFTGAIACAAVAFMEFWAVVKAINITNLKQSVGDIDLENRENP